MSPDGLPWVSPPALTFQAVPGGARWLARQHGQGGLDDAAAKAQHQVEGGLLRLQLGGLAQGLILANKNKSL